MFDIDIAIKNENEDVLNRGDFAKKLAKSIMDYSEPYPLTIGLNGNWGSGKTSLINLTLNYIEKDNCDDNFIIVHFNPWFFSNQKNLFLEFFKLIIDSLKTKETENESFIERTMSPQRTIFRKTEIAVLEDYSNYIKLNLDDTHEVNDIYSHSIDSPDPLSFYKKQCNDYFERLDFKVIVVIDDIERLVDAEINQIFTLVKSLANFNNFIYLLSFDKNIIEKSLDKINSEEGGKFIDKIIQIPIIIPPVSESKLNELIQKNLEPIYSDYMGKDFINHYNEFIKVSNFLNLFIKDIRDLKKFTNLLNFYWQIFVEELNINDFILMLAIQLFDYDLFLKIKKHKDLLTANNRLFKANDGDIDQEILNVVDDLKENEHLKELLGFIFPILEGKGNIDYEKWDKNHNACSGKHIDKYFLLSLENNEVSALLLDRLIKMNNESEIYDVFTQKINLDYNHSLLYQFSKLLPEIPAENSEFFIRALLRCGDEMNLYPDSRRLLKIILDNLFEKIEDKDKCHAILKESCSYDNNLLVHTQHIYSITSDSNLNDNNCSGELYSFKQIDKLKKLTVARLCDCCKCNDLLNNAFLPDILRYWKLIDDEENVNEHVRNAVKSDEEILTLLNHFQTAGNSKWNFDFEELDKYHGLDAYEDVLARIKCNENISAETEIFCETFILQSHEFKKNR